MMLDREAFGSYNQSVWAGSANDYRVRGINDAYNHRELAASDPFGLDLYMIPKFGESMMHSTTKRCNHDA